MNLLEIIAAVCAASVMDLNQYDLYSLYTITPTCMEYKNYLVLTCACYL